MNVLTKKIIFKNLEWLKDQVPEHILQAVVPKQHAGGSWNQLAFIKDKLDHCIEVGFASRHMAWVYVGSLEPGEVKLAGRDII